MVLKGRIENGRVVFDSPVPIPEGTEVRVEPVHAEEQAESAEPASIGKRLLKFSGRMKGLPADAARNHDHYLYGGPKK